MSRTPYADLDLFDPDEPFRLGDLNANFSRVDTALAHLKDIIDSGALKGDPGDPGQDGDPGDPGSTGPPGPRGSRFHGKYANSGALPAIDGNTVRQGDFAYVGSGKELWYAGASSWSLLDSIQGPQGNPGSPGSDGLRGLQGLPGAKGDKGDPGLDGDKGDTGDPGKSLHAGVGAPSGGLGADGDSYLDLTPGALAIWGPKTGGSWSGTGPKSIMGQRGLQGLSGLQGDKGDKGDKGDAGVDAPHKASGLDGNTTLTFNEGSRTLTLQPAAGSYTAWTAGTRRTISGALTVVVPDTEGLWYVWLNAAGALVASTTEWDLTAVAPVCLVRWDETNDRGWVFDRRHGVAMAAATRRAFMDMLGTTSVSGLTVDPASFNAAASPPTLADVTPGVTSGVIQAADLRISIGALIDGGPYALWARSGADGWTWQRSQSIPALVTSLVASWNRLQTGTWSTQAVASGRFVNTWVFACNGLDPANDRWIVVLGQTTHPDLATASTEGLKDIDLTGLPVKDLVPVARWTLEVNNTWTGVSGRFRVAQSSSLLGTTITSGSAPISNHDALSGRSSAGAHPSTSISVDPTGLVVVQPGSTNAHAAIADLDTKAAAHDTALAAIPGTYLAQVNHTKAAHDALGIDAQTMQGKAPGDFESAGAVTTGISNHISAKDHYRHRGTWASGTTYSVGDVVTAYGILWRCTSAHTSANDHLDGTKFTRMGGGVPPQVGSLWMVGHSYVDAGPITEGGNGRRYVPGKMMTALGLNPGKVRNTAQSGSTGRWNPLGLLLNKFSPGPKVAPRTANIGVGFLWWGGNDAIQGWSAGTWHEWTYKSGIIAAIARYRAGAVYEDDHSSVAYTGTWTSTALSSIPTNQGSGLSIHSSQTTNDKVTITTPNDMGRYLPGVWVTIGLIGGNSGAAAEVWLDGVKHGDVNTGRGAAYGTAFGHGQGDSAALWTPVTYRLFIPTTYADANNYTTTSHTIEVRHKGNSPGGAGLGLIFDYWSIDADEPPVVLALSMVQPPNARLIWAGLANPASHDTYNSWLKSAIATFKLSDQSTQDPSVRYVDVDYYMQGYTGQWTAPSGLGTPGSNQRWFSSDGLHPNEEGAKIVAEACVDEINRALFEGVSPRALLGSWSNEVEPIFDPPRMFIGDGTPMSVDDDFERTQTDLTIGGTGWSEAVGAWGIDIYGQAYAVDSGVGHFRYRDKFARANGSLGTLDYDTNSTSPPSWTVRSGTWSIASNQVSVVTGGTASIATIDLGSSTSQAVEATMSGLSADSDYGGVVLRFQDTSNYIVVWTKQFLGFYVTYITTVVAGVATDRVNYLSSLASFRAEVGADDVVRVWSPTGTLVSLSYTIADNVLKASNANAKYVGMYARPTCPASYHWDEFIAGTNLATTAARTAVSNVLVKEFSASDGAIAFEVGDGGTGGAVSNQGIVFRYQDERNYCLLFWNAGFAAWGMVRYNNGTPTSLGVYWYGGTTGTVVGVQFVGAEIRVYINGVNVNEFYSNQPTVTDAAPLTGTKHGLSVPFFSGDSTMRFRDFRWGNYMTDAPPRKADLAFDRLTGRLMGPYNNVSGGWGVGVALAASIARARKTSTPYTPLLAEAGYVIEMNLAGANVFTVPTNDAVPYPIGTVLKVAQYGAGQTTISAAGGVTIRSKSGWLKIAAQYGEVTLRKIGTDEWWLSGDLSA